MNEYEKSKPLSIENYAKKLLNKSLKQVLGDSIEQKYIGKGKLGQILEDLYFHYKPNSKSEPDFKEAGVELKTSPIKKNSKGYVSKERLVFNIIDYNKEYKVEFEQSSFWLKNNHLLLMFYLYEKGLIDLDYIFKIITLWKFPETDLKIIKDDWKKIKTKIIAGKAHEISEGDTLYLGACTKGANKLSKRSQPFSSEKAMQRAYSLKSKYLNFIIKKNLFEQESEPIIKSINQYSHEETFEDLVIKKFKKYYNFTESEILKSLKIRKPKSKHKLYIVAKKILGVKKRFIEEFEKAEIELKTIRLEKSGVLKESMSFAQIQYKEIIKEIWDESYWYETLTKRFLFVIFQKDNDGKQRLKKVMFWTMPVRDLEIAKLFWLDTKNKIKNDIYDDFIKISDNKICHVRPKGRDSKDLMETPTGRLEKKKCFWLNSSYIKDLIK